MKDTDHQIIHHSTEKIFRYCFISQELISIIIHQQIPRIRLIIDGMVKISSLIFNVAEELASSPERLKFREAGPKAEPGRTARRKGVTLGIMPDFAGIVKNGLRADVVYSG